MPEPASQFIATPHQSSIQTRVHYQGGSSIFSLGLILLILSGLASGGLYFYRAAQEQNKAGWQEQITAAEQSLKSQELNQLYAYADALSAAKSVLAAHVFPSNTFAFLSKNTHSNVQFTTYTFSGTTMKIELAGKAAAYKTVGEQIQLLEASPDVAQVSFGGLSLDESSGGKVSFSLTITFKPSLLRFTPPAATGADGPATTL